MQKLNNDIQTHFMSFLYLREALLLPWWVTYNYICMYICMCNCVCIYIFLRSTLGLDLQLLIKLFRCSGN